MKLFSILKKDLLILLGDRVEMAVLFLMPLAFIIPISIALGAGDGYGVNRNNTMISLPVADYDRGQYALALKNSTGESLKLEIEYGADLIQPLGLQEDADCATEPETPTDNPACIEKVGRALLQQSARSAVLVIPAGFSKAIDAGKPAKVTLLYNPGGDSVRLQQVEDVINGSAIKISLQKQVSGGLSRLNDLVVLAPNEVRQSVQTQVSQPQPKNQKAAVSLVQNFPEKFTLVAKPDTYQQTIPGYTVMFVFFISITMASSIGQERLLGTFRRLTTTPISQAELLGGKLLATMVIGLLQVFLLFIVGAVAFKLDLGGDPLAFFLLTITLVATATAIGFAASTTPLRGGSLAASLVIAALLGGCMFPLDMMPPFLRSISYLVPQSWALNGYQNLMVRGQGVQEVFPQIAVLLGFAAIFFLFALRRFEFDKD